MSHISLYRRYRPDTFDKVIGQTHIVRTLVNQIKTDNISHAYLFTGTRGTGKTSVARIFARAINCENPVNGSPCGKCAKCVELMNPSNMDIIEIDAASNNTVDEIRDLREKVKYPPVVGKYRVYIIDEVHMLTINASNALLKTLEEPPSHAVFILATTDVQKLPATILSRCMRFDFKLLTIEQLSDNLRNIFKDIGKKYSEEAVNLIATAAEGSARDSLSIADMCVAYSTGEITYTDVLEVLGASDPNIVIDIVRAVISRNVSASLETLNGLMNYGKNIGVLAKDIATYVRDILYIRNCAGAENILRLPKDIFQRLKEISLKATNAQLLGILDLFNGLSGELRYSTQPRIMLEAAIVRACAESGELELASRVKKIEDKLASGQIATAPATATSAVQKKNNLTARSAADLWSQCATDFIGNNFLALGLAMNKAQKTEAEGNVITAKFRTEGESSIVAKTENKKVIEEKLAELSGTAYRVNVEVELTADRDADIADRLRKVFGSDFKVTK